MIAKNQYKLNAFNVLTVLNFSEIGKNFIFQIFFWTKAVALVLMYAYGIKSAIQVSHPTYYKPQKWLQNLDWLVKLKLNLY